MAKPRATLERAEIAIVKAMVKTKKYNDQQILAFFTRPTRSINHRVIGEIRSNTKYANIKAASESQLDQFLDRWPDVDPETGLSNSGDELLIKAREAMIAAVHIFNGAGLTFRSELFIVTAVIAWTYLCHSWFNKHGIDYRHRDTKGNVVKTAEGAEKYWELSQCLKHGDLPISEGGKINLRFLLELRHEIEHRSTSAIDDSVGAQLQACCINFNNFIREEFGRQFGLEKRLPIALQFVTFDNRQRAELISADLPANISSMLETFRNKLTQEQFADLDYAYRVIFVPKIANSKSKADVAVEFVKADSQEAIDANAVFLKETDKKRYLPSAVVKLMQDEGYSKFKMHDHTELWQSLDARNPAKAFGTQGDYKGSWVWYENWVERVRAHCEENAEQYR
ncbi:DUF3644 domain-containing protein [Hyphobacterium sp.]|uniref:DUF3644 domain-containing protein n=1 Tax=Hyphobacterium sp. TaxID=2004662 RepID=UPI00374906C7